MVLKKDIRNVENRINELENQCNYENISRMVQQHCKYIENTLKMKMDLERSNLKSDFEDFTIKELREKGYKVKIEL